jgi:hypothetical protein
MSRSRARSFLQLRSLQWPRLRSLTDSPIDSCSLVLVVGQSESERSRQLF